MTGVFSRLVGQDAVEAELVAAAQAARGDSRSQCGRHRDHDTCLADHRPARVGALDRRAVFRRRAAVHHPTACPAAGSAAPAPRRWPAPTPTCGRIIPEGLSIGVDEMRSIVQIASRRPGTGRWQIVLIEDADRLTEGAANALLKVVEEPPPSTVFLLCAPSVDPEDIAITLRSRCRHVALVTPPVDAIAQVLIDSDGLAAEDARLGGVGQRRACRAGASAGHRRGGAAATAARAWAWRATRRRRRGPTVPPRNWSPRPRRRRWR